MNINIILVLLIIVLFLLVIDLLIIKRKRENFQSNDSNNSFNSIKNIVDYSKNSDKLLDMFKSLNEFENKCAMMEESQRIKEEKEEMRLNDKTFKELEEQDKKIDELKNILKYLNIEKKRKDNIKQKCNQNKQIDLNKEYDYLQKLTSRGLLKDSSLNLDLNVSDTLKNINLNNSVGKIKKNNKGNKNNNYNSKDYVNLKNLNLDKCYSCDKDKLIKIFSYINRDFK